VSEGNRHKQIVYLKKAKGRPLTFPFIQRAITGTSIVVQFSKKRSKPLTLVGVTRHQKNVMSATQMHHYPPSHVRLLFWDKTVYTPIGCTNQIFCDFLKQHDPQNIHRSCKMTKLKIGQTEDGRTSAARIQSVDALKSLVECRSTGPLSVWSQSARFQSARALEQAQWDNLQSDPITIVNQC
jgi:hypothetical protein